ncbi:hypothetical protein ACTFIW_003850 [Dictyostelium discoideum]
MVNEASTVTLMSMVELIEELPHSRVQLCIASSGVQTVTCIAKEICGSEVLLPIRSRIQISCSSGSNTAEAVVIVNPVVGVMADLINFNGSPNNVASGSNGTILQSVIQSAFLLNVLVPKPGTTLIVNSEFKRLSTYINNQSFKMEGIKNLPSMVKQVITWKGSALPLENNAVRFIDSSRIFAVLLRPVLRMLKISTYPIIAYLDDLLIVGSTKRMFQPRKTMDLLVKLGFQVESGKEGSRTNTINYFFGLQIDSVSMKLTGAKKKHLKASLKVLGFKDCCSPRKLAGLKGKLIALKDAVIPFRLYTRRTNKFHSQCLTLANGDWDQSFPIPQDVKSEISHWLTVLNQWNGKEISLFPSYDYVLTTDASESGAGATLKKGNKIIKTWSFQWSTTQSNMSSNRREMLALLMAYQALWWSDTGPISSVRTTLETMPQEESELDWRAYSRILQCKSRPPQPSFRDESQIVIQSNQELQLATEERSVQSHPTLVRSNTDGSVRISPEPSNEQLLNNQNECTPPRLESMEAMSGLPTTHSFAFYPGEDELIQFEEGFIILIFPIWRSATVSDDSSSSSSSSSSHVSSSTGTIPRSMTKQSVESIPIKFQQRWKLGIIQLSNLMVYSSSYTDSAISVFQTLWNPVANITLVVFMDYLAHLFKHKPPLSLLNY